MSPALQNVSVFIAVKNSFNGLYYPERFPAALSFEQLCATL